MKDLEKYLQEVRERCEAATEGPWEHDTYLYACDLDFMAHAREDIPKLLDMVDNYRSEIQRLVDLLTQAEPYIERSIPEPAHTGSCSPETHCDMDCSNAFHGSLFLNEVKQARKKWQEENESNQV